MIDCHALQSCPDLNFDSSYLVMSQTITVDEVDGFDTAILRSHDGDL